MLLSRNLAVKDERRFSISGKPDVKTGKNSVATKVQSLGGFALDGGGWRRKCGCCRNGVDIAFRLGRQNRKPSLGFGVGRQRTVI